MYLNMKSRGNNGSMKLLILTAFYPIPNGTHERMFVHVRNMYYQRHGVNVTVLNFAANENYEIDGIKVITLNAFKNECAQYDIVVSHSANIRNHYLFLKKYGYKFDHLVFFFHGHEMLNFSKDYPYPYNYTSDAKFTKRNFRKIYDLLKIRLWTNYYRQLMYKSDLIFVSNWLFNRFRENTGIQKEELVNKYHIINNSVGRVFETLSYDFPSEKRYDFITVRSNLDGSKYCIDLLVRYAEKNPQAKFLLIGKGKFFNYNKLPKNVIWVSKTLSHNELTEYINQSRCGLMLTREDTQGVMTCELVTYGIPVITSNIDVCHEFFANVSNVVMIDNGFPLADICEISKKLWKKVPYKKEESCFAKNTIAKELLLFKRILES